MMVGSVISAETERAVESAVRDLVRHERINGIFYVHLPLIYPDGSSVTVRIDETVSGLRISDSGFAFREVEDVGAARSFKRVAKKVAEVVDVCVGERAVYVETAAADMERAIIDVATASWQIADQICQPVFDETDGELEEALGERLVKVFGPQIVSQDAPVIGASTNEWPVSAIVKFPDHTVVFQAVSDHANSIYRASTAFRDIADLEKPPRLVAVVRSREALGSRLALLAPGKVIEQSQSDDLFRKVAA